MNEILRTSDKDILGTDKISFAEPRIAVNAVLYNEEGKVALMHMANIGLYSLPGGGVEPGEELLDAVKREIREETGYDCEIIRELGMVSENRGEIDFTQKRYYYIAKTIGEPGELQLTDVEISEDLIIEWYSLEDALQVITNLKPKEYVQKFIQRRDIAVLKEAILCRSM